MYKLIVTLTVADFEAFESFERCAAAIMADYDGQIFQAYETVRLGDGSGQEVHIVEFPSEDQFIAYKNDSRLSELSELRRRAITNTDVKPILKSKTYLMEDDS